MAQGKAAEILPTGHGLNEHRAAQMLDLAGWAAAEFATFEREDVLRIAQAAANAGAAKAEYYAEWAQRETGFGVAEHKAIKNHLCSTGIFDCYKDDDFVSFKVDEAKKIVEVPKPAGVIFALTPSTNPIATVFFKIVLCLLTRNSIVLGAHPAAIECCTDAVNTMARAAEDAGAPTGVIQVVPEPDLDVISFIMSSPKTDVILATGGTPMVRAAYSSGNPALGVGPGNAPAYVDKSADLDRAAKCLADSKSFDNSILCTNESAIIAHNEIAAPLRKALRKHGCHICSDEERDKVEDALFPLGRFNVGLLGRSAKEIAKACDIKVPHNTRVIVVPLKRTGDDYPLSGEKLCPVLGLYEVPSWQAGLTACKSMLRRSGGGHSAAVHASEPGVILRFGAELNVLRVAINTPCSTGAAGFDTNLAPTMTIGTGFFGRSSVAENLRPDHLVNWTRIAYDKDAKVDFHSFDGLSLHTPDAPSVASMHGGEAYDADAVVLREDIRAIILEELREAIAGLKV